jgi:hypothetical protein
MGNMSASFVWLQGQRGPVPQIWHTSVKREKNDRPILAQYKLTPEIPWSMDELVTLYPAPEPKL